MAGEKSALLVTIWPFFGFFPVLGVVENVPEVVNLQEDRIETLGDVMVTSLEAFATKWNSQQRSKVAVVYASPRTTLPALSSTPKAIQVAR